MAQQQGTTQILAQLGGGWMQCADAQGIFYHNSHTNQSSETPPPQFAGQAPPAAAQAAPQAQSLPQAAPAPAAKLKSTIGDWQICEDAQGEFYVHAPTGQTFNDAPPDLLRLVQAAQKPAAPPVQYAAPPAAAPQPEAQAKLKMTLGDWQICEDAQGEFYVHVPTGQTFDQPPPQLVQLYQATQKTAAPAAPAQHSAASASQYVSAAPQHYAAASQQYAAATQQYTAASQQYATTAPHYGAASYAKYTTPAHSAASTVSQYAPSAACGHYHHR